MTALPKQVRSADLLSERRVLLDTNVWSRLAGYSAEKINLVQAAANRAGLKITAAPSVLYELTRIPDPADRIRSLRLVTDRRWVRLKPEAYLETMEVLASLKKHRPQWVFQEPDLRKFRQLEYDWKRTNNPAKRRLRSPSKAGVWERFRHAPSAANAGLETLKRGLIDAARRQSERARKEMLDQGARDSGPLRSVVARYGYPQPGWRGDDIEPWRSEASSSLWSHLFEERAEAYLDWFAPLIDLRSIKADEASWTGFWLYEVEAAATARQWLRWAFHYQQRFRKVSPGNGGDAQLATYLVDADAIVSTDKQFVELTNNCRNHAPVLTAAGIRLPGDNDVLESLCTILTELRNANRAD